MSSNSSANDFLRELQSDPGRDRVSGDGDAHGDAVAEMIADSFAMIRSEVPAAFAQMCEPLVGKSVVIEVDGRAFCTRFESDGASVVESTPAPLARVRTSTRSILAVIEGRSSLARAVVDDEVEVVGPLEALVQMREVLHRYIHGVVRCPSAPALLVRFERLVRERART